MPSRRQFLRAAGLAATMPGLALGQASAPAPAASAAAKKAKPPPGSGILVNDVHAQLSSARVFAIEQPVDLDGVRKAIELARTEEKNVCFAGARHSMGGQPFAEDGVLVDTRKLNRVLNLDLERGRLEVEAGILWPQLLQGLAAMQRGREQPWTVLQRQTGAERLTVGGSLSSNMHGAGLVLAPFIADVESFRLLDAKGDVLNCSRAENPELFRLVAGGYGLFGLVHTVTLRLAPRRRLERVVELRDTAGIAAAFQSRIQEGFLYGDFTLQLDDKAPDFLSRGVFSCFRPAAPDQPAPERPARELSDRDWIELLYLAHVNKAEAFRRYAAYAQSTQGQLYWSDELPMTVFPENYHREVDRRREAERRSTETMCEIFCERERLEAFLADVRATARIERLDLIHCSVRLIEQDRESFLAWARKSYACITFHLHVEHNSSGTIRAGDQLRRLIDIGIKHGGSYYPTYHRYALRRQLDACFPQFQDFLKLKRKYDPQELFQSDWYRHYKKMYFGT